MSKGKQAFKETDVARALRAARKELTDFTLRITRDGICIEHARDRADHHRRRRMAGGVTKLVLQYVHEYRDRHGKLRRYFRRGSKKTVLPGLPGSDEFMASYRAALAGIAVSPPTIGASRTKPGTVNAAIVGYTINRSHSVRWRPAHSVSAV